MANLPSNIALVYDRVNKWGGAENVLLALHELYPRASLYTSVYSLENASWASVFPQVIPSFLQKIPFADTNHELLPWITPLAFESLDFSKFDAVISVTSADAKGIITRPHTFHLCYCLTPTRYLWSHKQEYENNLPRIIRTISQPVFNYLKSWDKTASARPDAYVAISKTVQNRVQKYYSQKSTVVYPPVDYDYYSKFKTKPGEYFLYVGRLVPYKKANLVVDIFNDLGLPLVIVGTGSMENKLKAVAKNNITFAGFVTRGKLAEYYSGCKALVFFHEEDFGIVPLEAQSAGKPVIAINIGGAGETVIDGQTGILINDPSFENLKQLIIDFNISDFDPEIIRQNAEKYSKEKFMQEFDKVFVSEWKKYKNIYTS